MQTTNYVNMNPLLSLAWVAGFVDGEAWVGSARQTRKGSDVVCHRLKVVIVQNNLEVLEQVKDILGELCFISKLKRTDKCNRQAYQLVYSNSHARSVLIKLLPFLRRKQYEADAALTMWLEGKMGQRPGKKGWPPEIYEIREKWAKKLARLK
jgi:hypothetical protein